jgi:hypothetical protein
MPLPTCGSVDRMLSFCGRVRAAFAAASYVDMSRIAGMAARFDRPRNSGAPERQFPGLPTPSGGSRPEWIITPLTNFARPKGITSRPITEGRSLFYLPGRCSIACGTAVDSVLLLRRVPQMIA